MESFKDNQIMIVELIYTKGKHFRMIMNCHKTEYWKKEEESIKSIG
jgi:hypothetical protein